MYPLYRAYHLLYIFSMGGGETMEMTCELAQRLMEQHGLMEKGWRFKFDRAKTICGQCDFDHRVISISKHYATDPKVPNSDIKNTILHEIAHALAGCQASHGPLWKAIAIGIGCDGATTNKTWRGAPSKYRISCKCGAINARRHKITRRKVCGKCGTLDIRKQ